MAVTHGIRKYYSSFKGLNEIVDDITRDAGFATSAENVQLLEDGALSKRRGYKIFAADEGGYAILGFDNIDPEDGTITEEILVVSDTLKRMKTATLTITNVNANGQDVTISVTGDSSSGSTTSGWGSAPWGAFAWGDPAGRGFILTVDVASLIDSNGDESIAGETTVYYLGDEIENPGLTIDSLKTNLNSSSHVSASATVSTATMAPFLELLDDMTIASGETVELTYYYTEEVTKDSGAGLSLGFAAFKTDDTASHLDRAIFNRSVYFTNGLDRMHQYDGQAFFRAGMEAGTIPTTASAGAGSLTGDYTYKVQPVFRDRKGTLHYGAISDASTSLTLSSQQVDATITNVEDGKGFDARGAYTDTPQAEVVSGGLITLQVDDGAGNPHTIVAGDKVRLFNSHGSTNDYAEYIVDSVTNTTITVQTTVDITVGDNEVISTGLFLDVYRTVTSGTEYFLVEQINNDPFNATQVYTDNTTDANLGARFIEPVLIPAEPPIAKYIESFNNSLVLANKPSSTNELAYSEPDQPTNFPELNTFSAESNDGGVTTGLAHSNETLVIFRERSIFLMNGDFSRDRISVTNLSNGGVGCISHASIKNINGVLFFLGERGVYNMAGAGIPSLISNQVIKTLTSNRTASDRKLKLKRAIAEHHVRDKQYILYIPAEETDSGSIYSNDNSLCLVYDYVQDNWTEWKNIHFSAGVAYSGTKLWFSSRELRDADDAVTYRVWRQHNNNSLLDYGDQLDGIEFKYASGWESIGNPSLAKKFLRLKIHSYTDLDLDLPISDFLVEASTEIDYKEHTPHSSFSFTFPDRGSTWDARPWDTFTWGGAQQPTYKTKLRKGQARSLRLVLENSEYDTNVIFTGFELEYAAPQGNTIKQ